MKKLLCSLSILLFSLTTGLYTYQTRLSDTVALHQVTNDLFEKALTDNTISLHYTLAKPENYGIKDLPVTLGTYSVSEQLNQGLLAENTLSSLSSLSRERLSEKDQLTYDILISYLKQQLTLSQYTLYPEPLSSQGVLTELPVLLAEYSFRNEEDIVDYLSLLSCIPAYLEDLEQYEIEKAEAGLFMSDASLQAVIDNCYAVCADKDRHFLQTSFENRLKSLALSKEKQNEYIQKHTLLLQKFFFPSYDKLSDTLVSLKGHGQNPYGLYYYEHGRDYYEYLTAESTGTFDSPAVLKKRLQAQLKEDYSELSSLLNSNPSLSDAVYSLDAASSLSDSIQSPEEMLSDLNKKTASVFPMPYSKSVSDTMLYELKYVDPSLEAFLSPAFYLTPPIDMLSANTIYINDISSYSGISLYTTLAHEGYPGHMLQNTYFYSTEPDPIRSLLYFGAYSEGWAVYAEQYSYTLAGLEPDLARILQLDHSIQLCICSLLDIMIHYEGLTPKQLEQYTKQLNPSIEPKSLDKIYQLIVDEPANYLKYYVGYLEICRLRTHAEEVLGDRFREIDFHEFILSIGPAPFSIIEKREDVWLKTVLSSPTTLCSYPLINSSSS